MSARLLEKFHCHLTLLGNALISTAMKAWGVRLRLQSNQSRLRNPFPCLWVTKKRSHCKLWWKRLRTHRFSLPKVALDRPPVRSKISADFRPTRYDTHRRADKIKFRLFTLVSMTSRWVLQSRERTIKKAATRLSRFTSIRNGLKDCCCFTSAQLQGWVARGLVAACL